MSTAVLFGRSISSIMQAYITQSLLFDCYNKLEASYTNKPAVKFNLYSINLHSGVKGSIIQSIVIKGE